jgi:hypothetical protein
MTLSLQPVYRSIGFAVYEEDEHVCWARLTLSPSDPGSAL